MESSAHVPPRARIAIDARKIRDFGIGTHIENLLRGLAELEGEEEFVVFLPPGVPLPVPAPRFRERRVAARGYGLAEHVELPAKARLERVDLVHVPHYVVPYFTPRPRIVTVHDLIHLRFPDLLPSRAARSYARHFLARAWHGCELVLTVSEASKRDLLEAFGGPEDRVRVIPNAVHELFFARRSREELADVRRRLDLPRPYVLYAGNVKPHKNLERLVEASALLRRALGVEAPDLVLAGAPVERTRGLVQYARDLGIDEHLRVLGRVEPNDLACVMRSARAFAFPSLYEGFGLPPLEAMACGVPVVCSNAASLPEVCGDGALLVDPLDAAALARELARVLTEPTLRQDLALRGLERARRFSAREQALRTLAAYRDVLGG